MDWLRILVGIYTGNRDPRIKGAYYIGGSLYIDWSEWPKWEMYNSDVFTLAIGSPLIHNFATAEIVHKMDIWEMAMLLAIYRREKPGDGHKPYYKEKLKEAEEIYGPIV